MNRFPLRLLGAALCGLLAANSAAAQSFELKGPDELIPSLKVLEKVAASTATVQHLSLPTTDGQPFQVVVTVRGRAEILTLNPFDIRTPGFQLVVDDGATRRSVPTPPSVTYRGDVENRPGSAVTAALYGGQLRAMFRLGADGPLWGVQPVSELDPLAPRTAHLVYDSRDTLWQGRCGNIEIGSPVHSGNHGGGSPEALRIAEIACEGDRPFYLAEGSNVTTAQNKITSIVNNVQLIYDRDVEIQYRITQIVIVSGTDPYTTTNPSALLTQFQNRWNTVYAGVQRDVAHLFTGRTLDGSVIGIAFLGVVCNIGSAYGLSERLGNDVSQTGLTAHELGHNWNAPHCSGSDCRIMCPGLGGCTGDITRFGQASINSIVAFKNSLGCLDAPPRPVLTAVTPNSIQAYPQQTLTLSGSGFTSANRVVIGSASLTNFTIVNDTTIRVTSPVPTALGGVPVIVVNGGGFSNPLTLTTTETVPARHDIPQFGVANFPLGISFGSRPNDSWFLIATFNNSNTIRLLGYDILSASPLTLGSGVLSGAGLGSYSFPVPNVNVSGIRMYTQLIALNLSAATLDGVSAVKLTTFF